jgi:paraquat-inducible protein B
MTAPESDATSPGSTGSASGGMPQATVTLVRRHRWVWLLPIAALGFAGFLYYTHLVKHGPLITIHFAEGHGLKIGDVVRCRGITVGQVETVKLTDALDGVTVQVRLEPESSHVARLGTRFWIVRPRFNLTGVEGLETITGPRYIAVLPVETDQPRQKDFTGLEDAPVMATEPPGGVEVFLYGKRRAGLRAGAPITYRQFQVGTIVSVGLTSDASSVEVRTYIRPGFTRLVRDNSKFWVASGAGWKLGLSGLNFEMDSIAALLEGGVAMSTPTNAGGPVSTGHRFSLYDNPEDEWLQWQPALAVGSDVLPDGAGRPTPLRAVVVRDGGHFWSRTHRDPFWLLPTQFGLLGPADAMQPPDGSSATAVVEVDGQTLDLRDANPWQADGLGVVTLKVQAPAWPSERIRQPDPSKPEDCVIIADPALDAVPVAAARLSASDARWSIDGDMTFNADLHGAAVLSRQDGKLIGVLLVKKGKGTVAPVPAAWPPAMGHQQSAISNPP